MAYVLQTWRDYPSGGTPISAAALNHMERGIADAHDLISGGGGSGSGDGGTDGDGGVVPAGRPIRPAFGTRSTTTSAPRMACRTTPLP
jgi:hypothetical protein